MREIFPGNGGIIIELGQPVFMISRAGGNLKVPGISGLEHGSTGRLAGSQTIFHSHIIRV